MSRLSRIIGQTELIERLRAFAALYVATGDPPGQILFAGPDGMGKRTIAAAFAEEYGGAFNATSSSEYDRKGDVTAHLSTMDRNAVLFIDEIHRLKPSLWEILIRGLRDFHFDLVIGQGRGARVHPYKLNRFTCIATVPKDSDCPGPLKDLFPLTLSFQRYSDSDIQRIAEQVASSIGLSLEPQAAKLIAAASKGCPHDVEVLLRHLAQTGLSAVSEAAARKMLHVFGVMATSAVLQGMGLALDALSGVKFEGLITQVLERMGFRAEMTKASGDGGIDIGAILDKPVIGGCYLLQCKRYAPDTPVGTPTVREFYGALTADRKAVKGVLMTTSDFTDQARDFARDRPVELIDHQQLRHLLAEHGMQT